MRGKIAKQLRKTAQNMTPGFPARRLIGMQINKSVHVTNPKHKEFGKTINARMTVAINDPKTTRGVYLALKKAYKKARRA